MTAKRNVIKSLYKLSPSLKSQFKSHYRGDYLSVARRITASNGEVYTVVPFETDDTMYMVKIKLKTEKHHTTTDDDDDDDDDTSGGSVDFDLDEVDEDDI